MSEFAYFRFMSNNMLTVEEQQHKDEIIALTEQVLDAKGIECDSKISKISELQEIMSITAYEDIKNACAEAIKSMRQARNKVEVNKTSSTTYDNTSSADI